MANTESNGSLVWGADSERNLGLPVSPDYSLRAVFDSTYASE